jgi:hypothetical protein
MKAAAKVNFKKIPGESIKAKVDLSWRAIASAMTQKTKTKQLDGKPFPEMWLVEAAANKVGIIPRVCKRKIRR